ncbi:hypothetical protein BASA81_001648 [Batrachochytrium salamandrivorans]|nr:hypothetical protein BASA81_001648 [Batrachochytrium salamandrivorans]
MSSELELEALLIALEKRIVDLESAKPAPSSAPSTDSELLQECQQLKTKNARLEYRIQILTRTVRELQEPQQPQA